MSEFSRSCSPALKGVPAELAGVEQLGAGGRGSKYRTGPESEHRVHFAPQVPRLSAGVSGLVREMCQRPSTWVAGEPQASFFLWVSFGPSVFDNLSGSLWLFSSEGLRRRHGGRVSGQAASSEEVWLWGQENGRSKKEHTCDPSTHGQTVDGEASSAYIVNPKSQARLHQTENQFLERGRKKEKEGGRSPSTTA